MQFEWDENKRWSNLTKHGFDFLDAAEVFEGPTLTFEDDRFAYGEQRFITMGLLKGRVIVIAHTESENDVRVISMRESTKHEQVIFFENL
ncbi:MAG: BrnT family toxin [Cyanobacteria bacterium J06560_5]